VNVTTDLSLLALVSQASLLVKLVMLLLLVVSLVSWWFIFRKSFIVRDTRRRSEDFERTFWSGPDLNQLFQSIVSGKRTAASMDRIFEAGFREFVKLRLRPACRWPWSWMARDVQCARLTSARWTTWNRTCRSWPPSAPSVPTWGCWGRYGAS